MIVFALLVLLLAPWIGWPWAIVGTIVAGYLLSVLMGLIGASKRNKS